MPAESVSDEIRHLMKDRGWPQDRAIAAAKSMERRGDFKGKRMKKRSGKRKSRRY